MKTCKDFDIELCEVCKPNSKLTCSCWIFYYKYLLGTYKNINVPFLIAFIKVNNPKYILWLNKALELYYPGLYNKIEKLIPLL
jgi:hypothetical protein